MVSQRIASGGGFPAIDPRGDNDTDHQAKKRRRSLERILCSGKAEQRPQGRSTECDKNAAKAIPTERLQPINKHRVNDHGFTLSNSGARDCVQRENDPGNESIHSEIHQRSPGVPELGCQREPAGLKGEDEEESIACLAPPALIGCLQRNLDSAALGRMTSGPWSLMPSVCFHFPIFSIRIVQPTHAPLHRFLISTPSHRSLPAPYLRHPPRPVRRGTALAPSR